MDKLEIILETEKNNGVVTFLHNGKPVKGIFEFDFHFNNRKNEITFNGKRFKTDKAGQYFVDPDTKDTAMEDINILALLNKHFMIREAVEECQKAIEFGLVNVYMTSVFNAEKLIKERNCELRKAG